MAHRDIIHLAERFQGLELHAAKGGRETLISLEKIANDSQQATTMGLISELKENIRFLLSSLPPYAPPIYNINQVLLLVENAIETGENTQEVKEKLLTLRNNSPDPLANQEKITEYLIKILKPGSVLYTHTLSETVFNVLLKAHRLGRLGSVIVTESRPNNDGWITAKKLAEAGVEVHLTVDAAMPVAVQNADLMLSGAEIIDLDGMVVGKVGTYVGAMLCEIFNKPLHIIAETNKFNPVPWQSFHFNPLNREALGVDFSFPSLSVTGTYFDVTPPQRITSFITEQGAYKTDEIKSIISKMKVSEWLLSQLQAGLKKDTLNEEKEENL